MNLKSNTNIKVIKRNVCSERLFEEINNALYDAMSGVSLNNDVHRQNFIEAIEDYLEDFLQDDHTGKITQFKVQCDRRNNPQGFDGKSTVFEVHYKQQHCLNFTKIQYIIKS